MRKNPGDRIISRETEDIAGSLLPEKISPAGDVGVTGVSEKRLQEYVSKKSDGVPEKIRVTEKKKGRLATGCDEMWYCAGSRKNRVWIWPAKDIGSRETAGCRIGNRGIRIAGFNTGSLSAMCRLLYGFPVCLPGLLSSPVCIFSGKTDCRVSGQIISFLRENL